MRSSRARRRSEIQRALERHDSGSFQVKGLLAGGFFLMGFYRAQGAILARFPWLVVGERKDPRSR